MSAFNEGKRIYRTREGRIVAGVCSGLAAYFGIDATIFRLAFAIVSIFAGMGVLCYLVAWMVIPEEGENASIVENLVNKNRDS